MANTNSFALLKDLTANFSATNTAVASSSSATTRALLKVRPDILTGVFDGHPFKIRAVVRGAASGAGNLVVNLYWDSGTDTDLTTFTSDILFMASGNLALATSSGVMYMEAIVLWDSAAGRLAAHWQDAGGFANLVTTPAIIKSSGAVATVNPIHASTVNTTEELSFFAATSISANGTSCKLLELALDQI